MNRGELEEFKRLSVHLMEMVLSTDTGAMDYEIYLNDDQSECLLLDRYQDSEALVEHTASGVRLFTPFLSI